VRERVAIYTAYGRTPTGEKKWGFIDKQGKIVITPQFDEAVGFHEGLAAVGVGGKYGFIDRTGRIVINPVFDSTMPFDGGLAQVTVNEASGDDSAKAKYKFGFIDKTGKYIWQPSQ